MQLHPSLATKSASRKGSPIAAATASSLDAVGTDAHRASCRTKGPARPIERPFEGPLGQAALNRSRRRRKGRRSSSGTEQLPGHASFCAAGSAPRAFETISSPSIGLLALRGVG